MYIDLFYFASFCVSTVKNLQKKNVFKNTRRQQVHTFPILTYLKKIQIWRELLDSIFVSIARGLLQGEVENPVNLRST